MTRTRTHLSDHAYISHDTDWAGTAHLSWKPEHAVDQWISGVDLPAWVLYELIAHGRKEVPTKRDWTRGPDGRSNTSDIYLAAVNIVRSIVSSVRVGSNPENVARTIVSNLAHMYGLAPGPKAIDETP